MKCKICNSETQVVFQKKIRNKYDSTYLKCSNCNFLFIENVTWLDEAYSTSINDVDTGYVERNLILSRFIKIYLILTKERSIKCLDFAGGYGLLVRLMRDLGFDYFWSDKYTQNLFAKDYVANSGQFDFLSAIEVAEHAEDPISFFQEITNKSKIVFFTTTLSDNVDDLEKWEYLGLDHGQHISFYSKKSLELVAGKNNLALVTRNNFHFLVPNDLRANTFLKMKIALFLIKFKLDYFFGVKKQ